jgi:bifunctional non-homologous end joining protein LigD
MQWRKSNSVRPASGFIPPCLPHRAKAAPAGPDWVFEIKFDGYRIVARKDDTRVRIYSKNGADFTKRYPRIYEAVRQLKARSAIIDGEAIVYNKGMPDFDFLHSRQFDERTSLVAFDLLELDGDDFRKEALVERKGRLLRLLAKAKDGIEFNDHIDGDGAAIFAHACRLGHEGIVAKRRDLPYQSGRSKRWLKIKNPQSPAMQRVLDETF